MDLRSAQLNLSFGITVVERYGIVRHSYDHLPTEHA